MYDIYAGLNLEAKERLLKELNNLFYKKYIDERLLDRCHKEINILYDKSLLFVIELLYLYKNSAKKVRYCFNGSINNLLLLYVLGLSNVNPLSRHYYCKRCKTIEQDNICPVCHKVTIPDGYNLPYELFNDNIIDVGLVNDYKKSLVSFIEYNNRDLLVIKGSFEKGEIEEINQIEDNHFLLIPRKCMPNDMLLRFNNLNMLETVDDYRKYKDNFVIVKFYYRKKLNISNIDYPKADVKNALSTKLEKDLIIKLNPQTIDDYIKIKSISHSTYAWQNNQDILFEQGKVNINNLIANREDVFRYLIEHKVSHDLALEITNFVRRGNPQRHPNIWQGYVELMRKNQCDELFINIISKVLYLSRRGPAVSECLLAMDENNYSDEKIM